MERHTFDLLTVQAPANGSRESQLGGALGEERLHIREKHPFAIGLASGLARLSPRHRVKLLGLDFELTPEDHGLHCRATGVLAPLMKKQAEGLEQLAQRLGRPAALREGGYVYNLYQPPVPSARLIRHICRIAVQGNRPPRPTTCTLQVTTHCQLNCAHCSAARFKTVQREELSHEEWLSVIRQAENLGCYNIVFTGGEPLLRPDIFDLVAAVDREKAHPMMFSNGILLNETNVAKLQEAGLYSLFVSVDDPRPEVHDELRARPGGFDKTVEGIRQAVEGGILVGISTYATPEDVREGRPQQIIELGRELGVHEVTVFDTVPTGKLLPLEQDGLLTEADKDKLIAMQDEYNAKEGYPHVVTQAFVNGPQGTGCFAGHAQFYMTAFGDVTPCDFTPLTFGNIRDDSLLDIWNRFLSHPAYENRCDHCRMQDPEFRRQYIDDIPDDVLLPWPASDDVRDKPHAPPAVTCHGSLGPAPCKRG